MSEAKSVAVQGPERDAGGVELLVRRMSRLVEKFGGRHGVDGFVDRVLAGEVIGWAFDPKKPHRRVHVVARCEGRIVAEALADLPRKDLAQDGKGDGRHGFNLRLPPALLDGAARQVRIEVGIGPARRLLRGGAITIAAKRPGSAPPPPPKPAPCHGVLESVAQGLLCGWAAHPRNGGTPAVVDVYDDERYLGSVTADRPRPGLREAGAPSGALGFQFRLPPAMDEAAAGRLRARIAGTRIDLRRSEGFPAANGRKPDAPSPEGPPVAEPVASDPASDPISPRAGQAATREIALLIVGEAGEARMRRATNGWAGQTWPELAIGAVGPDQRPADGEHRYGPDDEARLRAFLGATHSVVLAGPEEELEPSLARAVALGRPLCDVLTWERTPTSRREGDRLALLLGADPPGAFAVRGSLLAVYPGALARELAAGEMGGLRHWLAETPAARWGRLAGALSRGPAADRQPRIAPPPPARVTLAVWPEWNETSLASLEALAAAAPPDMELEALTPAQAPIEDVRQALSRANPACRRLTVRPIDGPASSGAGGWLRALGEAASGEVVIFCRAGVTLQPKPGCLAEIGGWAQHPLVGAVTVEVMGEDAATPLAGLCLRAARPGWSAISAFVPSLQGQARPVLGAPAAFMAISRAKLAALGGLDADRFPEDGGDLDLALRLKGDGLAAVLLGELAAKTPNPMLVLPSLEPVLALLDPDELAVAADAYPAPVHASPTRRRAPDAAA
jgi:hypothetical protein